MKIKTVTITGADDNTDIDFLIETHRLYPFVEFGILFSPSRQGTSRYPSLQWVKFLQEKVLCHCMRKTPKPKLSAHLCGNYTHEYLTKGYLTSAIKDLGDIMTGNSFSRYQLNFNSTKNPACKEFIDSLGRCTTNQILQFNKANYDLCQKVIEINNPNIHFLYDGSGGRGVLPENWQGVVPNHFTGYAGGLNPDNLEEALININKAVGDNEIWIDTETGVRTDDKLDLEKVVKFLEIAKKYVCN
jgi:phosphoribosylanthranilate isomerase